MACCQDGLYAPVGTACPGGVCNANGVCSASCPGTFENSQQTCSDGIDNNCNGIIDCEITSDGRINQGCQAFCDVFIV